MLLLLLKRLLIFTLSAIAILWISFFPSSDKILNGEEHANFEMSFDVVFLYFPPDIVRSPPQSSNILIFEGIFKSYTLFFKYFLIETKQ